MWTEAERQRAPVGDFPPSWASAWGDDRYGLWADLQIGPVVQRLRWIEPGSFQIGSPDDEHRRGNGEGPQNQVTLTRGYWLADTPCKLTLWVAVMGDKNSIRFEKGSDAGETPVESDSLGNVQAFLRRLQGLLPAGSEAMLPTGAQWAYASRAGTQTAYRSGDQPDLTRGNTDDSLGMASMDKRDEPNSWGLYGMRDNISEWCADGPGPYRNRPDVNPDGATARGLRILRGASRRDSASGAGSASLYLDEQGFAWRSFGFRLALRSPSPAGRAGGR